MLLIINDENNMISDIEIEKIENFFISSYQIFKEII